MDGVEPPTPAFSGPKRLSIVLSEHSMRSRTGLSSSAEALYTPTTLIGTCLDHSVGKSGKNVQNLRSHSWALNS
jgi:hypothetical protein